MSLRDAERNALRDPDDPFARIRANLERVRCASLDEVSEWLWEARKARFPEEAQPRGAFMPRGDIGLPYWQPANGEVCECCPGAFDAPPVNISLIHCRSRRHCRALVRQRPEHFTKLFVTFNSGE